MKTAPRGAQPAPILTLSGPGGVELVRYSHRDRDYYLDARFFAAPSRVPGRWARQGEARALGPCPVCQALGAMPCTYKDPGGLHTVHGFVHTARTKDLTARR